MLTITCLFSYLKNDRQIINSDSDIHQESAPPTSPPLSLSPRNLDLSGEEEEDGGGEEGGGGSAELSLDMSPSGTPPGNFNDAVKAFDAAIGEELEKEETLNDGGGATDGAIDSAASAGTRCCEFVGGAFSADNQMTAERLSTREFSSVSSRSSLIVQQQQQPAAPVTSSSR